jgi:hypothetical protein
MLAGLVFTTFQLIRYGQGDQIGAIFLLWALFINFRISLICWLLFFHRKAHSLIFAERNAFGHIWWDLVTLVWATFWVIFSTTSSDHTGLGHILGDFFAAESGHTGLGLFRRRSSNQSFFRFFNCSRLSQLNLGSVATCDETAIKRTVVQKKPWNRETVKKTHCCAIEWQKIIL